MTGLYLGLLEIHHSITGVLISCYFRNILLLFRFFLSRQGRTIIQYPYCQSPAINGEVIIKNWRVRAHGTGRRFWGAHLTTAVIL